MTRYRRARRTAEPITADDLRESVLESPVQKAVMDTYRRCGCVVVRLGGANRWTPNDPGVPDLLVYHVAKQLHWAHETKRIEYTAKGERRLGTQSEDQQRMQRLYEACTDGYALGGVEEAVEILMRLGVIRPDPAGAA